MFIVAILFISCSNNDLDINPYVETKTYGPVIEQIHLEQYTVITYITRTYIVDTDTLINGSAIIKPNELYEISYGCNYNSWRFSHGEANVYCITSFHGFDVKKELFHKL